MQDDLSADGRALLDAITEGIVGTPTGKRRRRRLRPRRRAWSMLEKLQADGHSGEALDGLSTAGLVAHWSRPDGPAVTLTPWGKAVQGVEILERPTTVQEEEIERDKDGKRIRVRVAREDVELYWGREEPGRRRTLQLPYRRREFSTPLPELIPDPAPGPEYLLDDDGDPVKLFEGLFAGQPNGGLKGGIGASPADGVKVELDARLGGATTKKGKPPVKARARRRRRAG